ncbi:monooxygenase 2-like [Impatiens glandulifera]|uniref:monooxygenase 2-like n=1 Tax=Impatiens glandulifera TaxID=253017 RepID=UPI001FB15FBE|nr:monooxygenase 2-like [Impatiens glandulifera]
MASLKYICENLWPMHLQGENQCIHSLPMSKRLGLKSLVLESSNSLRVSGFALTLWTNAWWALDALGVADSLRTKFPQIKGFELASAHVSSSSTSQSVAADRGVNRPYECPCVKRNELLETLAKELSHRTIRFSSKLLSIHHQQSKGFKALRG